MATRHLEYSEVPAQIESVLRDAKEGRSCIVTENGVPLVELRSLVSPREPRPCRTAEEARVLFERFEALGEGNQLGGLTFKELRDEGRR